jgi:hypothetical protein
MIMESYFQSTAQSAERTVSMTTSDALRAAELPAYAELQRQIHCALRAQHSEWIQPTVILQSVTPMSRG